MRQGGNRKPENLLGLLQQRPQCLMARETPRRLTANVGMGSSMASGFHMDPSTLVAAKARKEGYPCQSRSRDTERLRRGRDSRFSAERRLHWHATSPVGCPSVVQNYLDMGYNLEIITISSASWAHEDHSILHRWTVENIAPQTSPIPSFETWRRLGAMRSRYLFSCVEAQRDSSATDNMYRIHVYLESAAQYRLINGTHIQ
ncbi:hypothetical protein B0H16DRAFT_988338 [Mycena metata]|uniref:Uncharacterized protein n=1 Tax=Mycena metata TaxID=1033252 RepID=A0AAD7IJQ3_9AGAR|nr:hypothetical protein B0H16DRAFT_988338 [Mycena metata]